MTQTAILVRANRLIDRFQPPGDLAPHDVLSVRMLIGGALLGLFVAACSVVTAILTEGRASAAVITAFGGGLLLVLAMVRSGVSPAVASRFCLVLLGTFFLAVSLLTKELHYTQLKWLGLLPIVALFLSTGRPEAQTLRQPPGLLWFSTSLAILLGVAIVVCNRFGLTAGIDAPPVSRTADDIAELIDFAMFMMSVAGLLWVHQLALRRSEDELRLLRSMLAICAWCRRIRDAEDGWVPVERHLMKHAAPALTHGICPDCTERHFADLEPANQAG